MHWKKELKSWGLILSVFAFLYFTGLITPIMGGLQPLLLATGIKNQTALWSIKKTRLLIMQEGLSIWMAFL